MENLRKLYLSQLWDFILNLRQPGRMRNVNTRRRARVQATCNHRQRVRHEEVQCLWTYFWARSFLHQIETCVVREPLPMANGLGSDSGQSLGHAPKRAQLIRVCWKQYRCSPVTPRSPAHPSQKPVRNGSQVRRRCLETTSSVEPCRSSRVANLSVN